MAQCKEAIIYNQMMFYKQHIFYESGQSRLLGDLDRSTELYRDLYTSVLKVFRKTCKDSRRSIFTSPISSGHSTNSINQTAEVNSNRTVPNYSTLYNNRKIRFVLCVRSLEEDLSRGGKLQSSRCLYRQQAPTYTHHTAVNATSPSTVSFPRQMPHLWMSSYQ